MKTKTPDGKEWEYVEGRWRPINLCAACHETRVFRTGHVCERCKQSPQMWGFYKQGQDLLAKKQRRLQRRKDKIERVRPMYDMRVNKKMSYAAIGREMRLSGGRVAQLLWWYHREMNPGVAWDDVKEALRQ